MKKMRYFDYAATTPTDKQVLSAMLPYFSKKYGNPGSLYRLGRDAKFAVQKSTEAIAKILNCRPDEFVFTGSATEADNLAILGVTRNQGQPFGAGAVQGLPLTSPKKIIVSSIEHKAVLKTCESLGKDFEIVKLPVLKNGLVDLEALKKELDEQTILVSVTMADSETGTLQPISEISKIIKDSGLKIYFHTDASQAAGYLDINVEKLGIDMMTISSHKLYGPKGIGGLYVRKGVKISPIIHGGGQQAGLRSGTENIPSIIGFAKALEIAAKNRRQNNLKIKKLRDTLEKGILKTIPKVILNGHPISRLPNFLNISILDIEGEAMLLYLDELGIMVATGSACNSQSLEPSYILTALGNSYEYIHGSLRFTLGRGNTAEDVKFVLKNLPKVVLKLRKISPLNFNLNKHD